MEKDGLVISGFLGDETVTLAPLDKDRFGCRKGYLIFHRGEAGELRDFILKNSDLDSALGAIFIKK